MARRACQGPEEHRFRQPSVRRQLIGQQRRNAYTKKRRRPLAGQCRPEQQPRGGVKDRQQPPERKHPAAGKPKPSPQHIRNHRKEQ